MCGSCLGFGWFFLNDHQNHFINSQKITAAALLGCKDRELPIFNISRSAVVGTKQVPL